MSSRILSVIVASALAGCASSPAADTTSSESAIVGGAVAAAEHPGAGYLIAEITTGPHAGTIVRAVCGATLVAEDAVVTSASCVSDLRARDRKIVAVGFGDIAAGRTIPVVGSSEEWVHPRYVALLPSPHPDAEPVRREDVRHGLAVIGLAEPVTDIAPVALASSPVEPTTPATVIGHGAAAMPFNTPVSSWPDQASDHPVARRSASVEIAAARHMIVAYPRTPSDGGMCFGDGGSPLLLADGTLAGVFVQYARDVEDAWWLDDVDPCRADAGGNYVNLHFADLIPFVHARIAAIHAASR